jgi:hypothetical protein
MVQCEKLRCGFLIWVWSCVCDKRLGDDWCDYCEVHMILKSSRNVLTGMQAATH